MRPHFSRNSLHLVWTVPLAFAPGYVAARLVGFDRCGIDGCLGDPGGFASPSAPAAVNVALGAGLLMFAALALTPWLRPIWLRLSVGLGISVLLSGLWIWLTLFER